MSHLPERMHSFRGEAGPVSSWQNTYCHNCGTLIIEMLLFYAHENRIDGSISIGSSQVMEENLTMDKVYIEGRIDVQLF